MQSQRIADNKTCFSCKQAKPLSDFHNRSCASDGKNSNCKPCALAKTKTPEEKARRHRVARAWAVAHPAKASAAAMRWQARNPAKVKGYNLKKYAKQRTRPEWVLQERIKKGVWKCVGRHRTKNRWFDLLGYSVDELRAHLERQFVKGMTWENMGQWHIDHIIPLSSFSIVNETDPNLRRAWAMTNLRPLWGRDNMRKGAKVLTLL